MTNVTVTPVHAHIMAQVAKGNGPRRVDRVICWFPFAGAAYHVAQRWQDGLAVPNADRSTFTGPNQGNPGRAAAGIAERTLL